MAQTCPSCHFAGNSDGVRSCQLCGASLGGGSSISPSPPSPPAGARGLPHISPVPASTVPAASATAGTGSPQLDGLITWYNQTSEQADFNWFRFLSQSIIFLTGMPLILAIFAASFIFWLAFVIVGFHGMARSVSPFGFISGMNSFGTLMAVIFPRIPRCDQTPTVRMTVHAVTGERPALIKGELVSGTFRRGDDVELYGEWRNGTLVVQRGWNRSLSTAIELRRDHWRLIFIILLAVLFVAGLLIFSQVAHR